MKSVSEEIHEVLDTRCHNLDEQLNVALQLVRDVRAKRYKQAKEIAEHLGINLTNKPEASKTARACLIVPCLCPISKE